ncbi:iron siderophore ABC transporter, periplasmic substrate-binding protein [Campylobacter blaseri]|uniref:ABC transporter substrate-binding protein n=1 Tax=Campylobacter blaseri TaxID=2042961 RepID=A0A2P8R0Z1_9BACT|nr:ABC transporter substrate-binding protein [Campylobacter blaseri]PSM52141.1 ABC transporter substrate-binding protein [Campylobacter blaseri]PSM53907.1 ABC transporter substrate-binding protein [Campylobacter blaseri]QKF85341.1 iron siderophore ABC transporter, periplasmic substrate-binding protein [Campylobacter blaseri]
MVRVALFVLMLHSFVFGVVDAFNRDIVVENPQNLVFVGSGALRFGVYLGLEDRIVGIENREKRDDMHAPYNIVIKNKKLDKKPTIGEGGSGKLPSMEALIEANPDLIIASAMSKDQVKLIETKTKLPVFVISYSSSDDLSENNLKTMKQSLMALGEITNSKDRAVELIKYMEEQEKELRSLPINKKSVYIGGVNYKGSWGIGSTEGDYLPFSILGIENSLVDRSNKHVFIDIERILSVNPDVIFIDEGGRKNVELEMENKKDFFNSLKAFNDNKVFWLLPFNFYNTNLDNTFINAWSVAKALGANVDLEGKKDEIYRQFLGI